MTWQVCSDCSGSGECEAQGGDGACSCDCDECDGTGVCQWCGGDGEIDDVLDYPDLEATDMPRIEGSQSLRVETLT
jgi:hypothetical protein